MFLQHIRGLGTIQIIQLVESRPLQQSRPIHAGAVARVFSSSTGTRFDMAKENLPPWDSMGQTSQYAMEIYSKWDMFGHIHIFFIYLFMQPCI